MKKRNLAVDELIDNKTKLISTSKLCELLAPYYKKSTVREYLYSERFPFSAVRIGHRNFVSKTKAENFAAKKAAELAAAEAEAEA